MAMTSQPAAAGIEARLDRYRRSFDLSGKTALVLGAASGIGKASAEALAALGATLICADIDREGVAATASAIGAKAHVVDGGKPGDIRALAAGIQAENGRL